MTVIDGATNTTAAVSTFGDPSAIAVSPVSNRIYVANNLVSTVTVITEQVVNAIPLTVAIAPLNGNQTTNPQPSFTFTTTSTYTPTAPPVEAVYYQVDTWQGPWLQASGAAPSFTARTPVLRLGTHILYAYAADGQTADSIQTGLESSPIIGQITAYVFTVLPSAASVTVGLAAGPNPSSLGHPVTYTARVNGSGNMPTGAVQFYDGASALAQQPVTLDANGVAILTTSALNQGVHAITAIYGGDSAYSSGISTTVYQLVQFPTSVTLALTGGSNPAQPGAALVFSATVTTTSAGTPTGTVTFMDGSTVLGSGTAGGGGNWSFPTSSLGAGLHSITAVYSGDAGFSPSTSNAFIEVVTNNGSASSTGLLVNGANGNVNVNFGMVAGRQGANFAVTITPSTATGNVVLLEGTKQLGPILTLTSGQASYQTQLSIGQHNVRAVYLGDGVVAGGSSPTVVVNRSPRPQPR